METIPKLTDISEHIIHVSDRYAKKLHEMAPDADVAVYLTRLDAPTPEREVVALVPETRNPLSAAAVAGSALSYFAGVLADAGNKTRECMADMFSETCHNSITDEALPHLAAITRALSDTVIEAMLRCMKEEEGGEA